MPQTKRYKLNLQGCALLLLCLLSALVVIVLVFRRLTPSPEPAPPEPEPPNTSLVTRAQIDRLHYTDSVLGEMRWTLSDLRLEELNRVLEEYGITSPEEISQFLAQAAVETAAGRHLTETGTEEYFQSHGYSTGTRGAGYLQLTFEYGQMAFAVWMMKKYVPELADLEYVNPAAHGAERIADAYYGALQRAANLGLDVSRWSRIVYSSQSGRLSTGADYIAEEFPWESAGYYWLASGISSSFYEISTSLNTDIASRIIGGSGWQSRREAYAAFYPVLAELEQD